MIIQKFTFNPFQENTYIVYDETKECIIIDPGCYSLPEEEDLVSFINDNGLIPVKLVNTHCHIDHICGNMFIHRTYKLPLEASILDSYNLELSVQAGKMYGVPIVPSPEILVSLQEGEILKFGNTEFKILHTPGHSSGSLSFYNEMFKTVISGDALFKMSIGRSDLPGGNHDELLESIRTKLFVLPKETVVYSGHGEETTIGYEIKNNPFF